MLKILDWLDGGPQTYVSTSFPFSLQSEQMTKERKSDKHKTTAGVV